MITACNFLAALHSTMTVISDRVSEPLVQLLPKARLSGVRYYFVRLGIDGKLVSDLEDRAWQTSGFLLSVLWQMHH